MAPKADWTQARFLHDDAVKEEHKTALRVKGVNHRTEMASLRSIPWRSGAINSRHTLLAWVTDSTAREPPERKHDDMSTTTQTNHNELTIRKPDSLSVDVFRHFPKYSVPKPSEWEVRLPCGSSYGV